MSTYSVNGKGHRTLASLEPGPLRLDAIRVAVNVTGAAGKKLWHTVGALIRDGLVTRHGDHYCLTAAGADALVALRSGHPVTIHDEPTPSVRLFARRAA